MGVEEDADHAHSFGNAMRPSLWRYFSQAASKT